MQRDGYQCSATCHSLYSQLRINCWPLHKNAQAELAHIGMSASQRPLSAALIHRRLAPQNAARRVLARRWTRAAVLVRDNARRPELTAAVDAGVNRDSAVVLPRFEVKPY